MRVLLPLPFSPARQCTSPRPTENDTSSSARTPPKRTDTCSKRIASEAGMERFGDGAVMEVNTRLGLPLNASGPPGVGLSRFCGRGPGRSEPEIGELVDRLLGDRRHVVRNDIMCFRIGMDDAEALDRRSILDLLSAGQHLADADEDAASLGRIPHVPARDRALLEELASLPGRKRSDHEHLAHETLLFDRPGG